MIRLPWRFHDELPDIIGRPTDRLVARFEGQTPAVQAIDGIVGVTREKDISLDRQQGNRKRNCGIAW